MREVQHRKFQSMHPRRCFFLMRTQFGKQLYACGIARHAPDVIARKGSADLNALAAFLGERRSS